MKSAELLLNTRSRTGSAVNKKFIINELQVAGITIRKVHQITKKTSFEEVVTSILASKPTLLVVASGDGTLSSVVDKLAGTTIELGIIPLGTTNNFARSLAIPFDTHEAIKVIGIKKARSIDLGLINGQYFSNVAGIGLSARIASNVKHAHKQRWGRFAYVFTAIKSVYAQKPFRITIQDPDDEFSVTLETRQFIVANGRFHSGKEIAGDTKIDNGQLILFALGGGSRRSLIYHTLDFYFGSRKQVVHASYFVGKKVTISTSSPQNIELDGEVRTSTPARVQVKKAAIKVRY